MTTPKHTVTCLSNTCIGRDVYEFVLEKPAGFTFTAGQFVLFDVPLLSDPADIQTRAFSIASAPSEEHLIFVTKLKAGGRASDWIEQSLKEGSQVVLQGPFGRFTMNMDTSKSPLFVCTSTGNAPFRSMIISALEAGDTRRMDLIFGVREESDLFWVDDFKQLAQQYENFYVHTAISQPDDDWKGHKGRVQTLVPQIETHLSERSVYICGNPDMTGEVKKLCLEEWGVAKEDLHVEGYI